MPFTRFERARLLGARALQISMGAPPLVDVPATDPMAIASAEFENSVVPMTSARVKNARD